MNAALMPTFVIIPHAPFLMGSREAELNDLARAYSGTRESYREETPQHQLRLPAFAIARTPTTNALYAAYVTATNAPAPRRWRSSLPPAELLAHPVVDVSWADAHLFCAWLCRSAAALAQGVPEHPSENESRTVVRHATTEEDWRNGNPEFRLPSEAEWEHAARGPDGRRFPWGQEWDVERANTREAQIGGTRAVGSYPTGISPYGCLDMAGTIWEWTSSLDRGYPYDPQDGREDALGLGRRILRGGCYANPHGYARCACRFRMAPGMRNEFLGFRLAFSLPARRAAPAAI